MKEDVQKELVSIIVPAYNCTKYLKRCVNSIRRQTWRNIEIIIVEDGSTDDGATPALCDKLAAADKRIKIVHQQNSGPSAARKKGVDVCTGVYVMFVDADDYIKSTIVEQCVSDMHSSGADIVCFDYVKETNGKHKYQPGFAISEPHIIDSKQAIQCMFTLRWLDGNMWCKLYKKSIIQNIAFDERRHCDFVTMLDILKSCSVISVMHVIGYCYNIINESRTRGRKCHPRITEYEDAALAVYKEIQYEMPDVIMEAQFYYLYVLLYVNMKMEKDDNLDRKTSSFREVKSKLRKEIKTYFSNPYNNWKGKLKYLLCYFNLFRICYSFKAALSIGR